MVAVRPASRGFNEAGAFLPRRCALLPRQSRLNWRASMRPGHFYPGDIYRAGGKAAEAAGFNEAGAFLPRRLRIEKQLLLRQQMLQ